MQPCLTGEGRDSKSQAEGTRPSGERSGQDAQGSGGLYEGPTLEGISTVSAYWLSPTTNWSVHIGVPREVFDFDYAEMPASFTRV